MAAEQALLQPLEEQSVVRQSGIYNKFWLDILKEEYHDVYGPACMDAGNVGNVKADLVMKGKCLFDITFTELDNGYLQGSWDPYGTNNFDGARRQFFVYICTWKRHSLGNGRPGACAPGPLRP